MVMLLQIVGEILLDVVLAPLTDLFLIVVFYIPGFLIVTVATLGNYPEQFFGEE